MASSASVTSVTATGVSTITSTSLTTAFSTVTLTSGSTSVIASVSTVTSETVTSSVFLSASTTFVAPSTSSTSLAETTATITRTPTGQGSVSPSVVIITSTAPPAVTSHSSSTSSSSAASSSASALSTSSSGSSSSGGLTTGGKIAIAVIIPVVVIAALFFLGLFLWRKRKARKSTEELRKNEMAEYGFNPNHDQTLAPVAAAAYVEDGSDANEDTSGYRGWGATTSNRKASTTMGSNNRPIGMALSDGGSQAGGHQYQPSPNGNGQGSGYYSAEHPMTHHHGESIDGVGALGGAAVAGAGAAGLARHSSGKADIRRGPSNASSAYSDVHAHSDASSDTPAMPGPYYQEEVPYNIYNDQPTSLGPYGDGTYGGAAGQPVIRDVQARRNTRIERAPTFPQTQGGIAQNF